MAKMNDFIYSIYIKKENASATAFKLKYGVNDDSFWLFKIDIDNKVIAFGNSENENIKTVDYSFASNREYKVNLVVNDGVAKAYVDDSDISLLTFKMDGYAAGEVVDNLAESLLNYSGRNLSSLNTLSGDIFCSGYTILKVVNLTDGNYKLSADEYVISNGVITIKESYLNTLENGTEYKFRAVTSLTDLDFYVTTKEVGAQVNSLVEKYYRGDDAKFELSEATTVKKAVVDKNEIEFTQNNELITIKSKDLEALTSGEHVVKFYTENGQPEAKFSIYEVVETLPEVPTPVNHMYFFIDIAIFGVLIVGYILFTQLSKKGSKKV